MDVWELVARESIRDLIACYAVNVDRGQFDDVAALFSPDATFELRDRRYEGRDEIRGIFTTAGVSLRSQQGSPIVRHVVGSHQIDVLSPIKARSQCYYVVFVTSGLDHWGRYLDEFAPVDGRWRFTSRRDRIDGAVSGGWADSH